jgi:hypothetical protein
MSDFYELPMINIIWKITAGALIPSAATIIFNLLNFLFENRQTIPLPVAVGCASTLIGICVATKEQATSNKLIIMFSGLILLIIGGELLAPVLLNVKKSML